jgi:hypothetical protein
MDPSSIETGLLAGAALRHGGQLALLPAGVAHVARVSDLTLGSSGEKKHVTGAPSRTRLWSSRTPLKIRENPLLKRLANNLLDRRHAN